MSAPHWAVSWVDFPAPERRHLKGLDEGSWKSEHLDPLKACEGARGRCTLYPLSSKAEDICEVNGTETLIYQMTEEDSDE